MTTRPLGVFVVGFRVDWDVQDTVKRTPHQRKGGFDARGERNNTAESTDLHTLVWGSVLEDRQPPRCLTAPHTAPRGRQPGHRAARPHRCLSAPVASSARTHTVNENRTV